MLEADSWADAPDCVFLNTCNVNSVKEVSSLSSEDSGTFHYWFGHEKIDAIDSELCQNGPILDNKNASVGGNSCSFSLGPISQPDNLSFFHNHHVDEDTNDLSHYSWSEMGNFEDVDMMFSSDSTFGLGAGNEDDLGWFSSSDAIEGSGDGLRSGFRFQNPASTALANVSGRLEVPRTKETGSSVCDSGTKYEPLSYDGNLWPSQKDELANLRHLAFMNGSSNSECRVVPLEKISIDKKHTDHQNRLEGMRKGVFLENGDALHNIDGLVEEGKHTEDTGPKDNLISSGIQQQNEANDYEPESGYLCSSFSYMSDYSCSEQTDLHPTSLITESGNNGFMLPKDCQAPNHVQTMQRSPNPSFQMATTTASEKKAEKLLQHSGIQFENSSDLESITTRIPAELGSSVVAGSTSISSGFDEVAEEDAGFHQLQHITGRLDTRTKLCIRDSLYRLAWSADQRHREANVSNGSGDDRDRSQPLISEKTNKRKGYMDMERETNPVDRSIAHLLFLRSSVSSVAP